jgi:hypothetical protein
MAAGQGFKTFTTGEVLTAGDVNGYLMQGINVFTNATARDAAITVPAEGQFAFTKDTNSLWYYDGAAWVASGATGDIEGVTAGVGISGGGTSGTVTVTNSMATAIDAKADLIAGTGADTFSRLAVGANGTVLTADSGETTGLKWATPASGSMTVLASGSLSGASLDLTSISGSYLNLQLVLRGFGASATSQPRFTVNNTASIYAGTSTTGATSLAFTDANINFAPTALSDTFTTDNFAVINFFDYANTSSNKIINSSTIALQSSGTTYTLQQIFGAAKTTSAISRITVSNSSGDWQNGTYILYGVK